MRDLGYKTEARKLMQAAGVPVVPGTLEPIEAIDDVRPHRPARSAIRRALRRSPAAAARACASCPRAMRSTRRSVRSTSEARRRLWQCLGVPGTAIDGAPRGSADPGPTSTAECISANAIARCSADTRKSIEESPSPRLAGAARADGEVAVRAALAAGYTNAGTVEFLLRRMVVLFPRGERAPAGRAPVTELVTGIDLVHEQLRIAAGEPLGTTSRRFSRAGYAVECRIYAEDPARGSCRRPVD